MNEDIFPFLLAFQLAVFGIVLLIAAVIRRHSGERIIFLAGLLMLCYGLEKTLASGFFLNDVDEKLPTLFLWFRTIWLPASLVLGTLIVREVINAKYGRATLWILVITASYTVVSLTSDIVFGTPMTLESARHGITIVWAIVILVYLFRYHERSTEIRILRLSLLVLLVAAINDNLVNLSAAPWNAVLGPLVLLLFSGALGMIAVLRFLRAEKKLVSLDTEIQAAREIQQSILPQKPATGSRIDIAVQYCPMERVAGDFYEFLIADQDKMGILITDVSGHGIPAAMIASMIKMAATAQISHAHDPARVLDGINQALCGKLKDKYVTGAYVFIDPLAKVIKYSGAGHPAMLVLRRDSNEVEEIEENGLILGLFREAEYSSVDIPMSNYDTLVLYTDGITEAEDKHGEMFGLDRLKSCAIDHIRSSVTEISNAIIEQVNSWTGGKSGSDPDDDITLIVADCAAEPLAGTNATHL